METMDFSIAKKICVAYNIYKGEDIMERIQKMLSLLQMPLILSRAFRLLQ